MNKEIFDSVIDKMLKMTPEEYNKLLDEYTGEIGCCPVICEGQCQGAGGCGVVLDFHGGRPENFKRR